MSTNNSNKHLTDVERSIIETGIKNGSTQTAIAKILGQNKSTIGREITEHRELKSACKLPVECAIYAKCKPGIYCKGTKCENFVQFTCTRRDISP